LKLPTRLPKAGFDAKEVGAENVFNVVKIVQMHDGRLGKMVVYVFS
jgi:hypothetical protein